MALLFEDRIKGSDAPAFIQKVKSGALMRGWDPDWLMFVMNNESGFDSSIQNSKSNATGLIQFMPDTAMWLGTDVDTLKNLSKTDQLDWVFKYYDKVNKKPANAADLALITFYPYAIGKPDDYVIGSEKSPERAAKIGADNYGINNGKPIRLMDYKNWLIKRLPAGLDQKYVESFVGLKKAAKITGALILAFGIGFGIFHLFRNRKKILE